MQSFLSKSVSPGKKLQEDYKIPIYGHFFQFWGSGSKCKNQLQVLPKKVEFQACFYQNFTENMAFKKQCH